MKHPKVTYLLGDIRDYNRVNELIRFYSPDYIVVASALKHIDKCEYEVGEAMKTNVLGVENVIQSVLTICRENGPCPDGVLYISTDKACSPINTYGLTKALGEKAMISTAYKTRETTHGFRFMVVRYGNVLGSRGSIMEVLNKHFTAEGANDELRITDENMTRFIMTQLQAVRLINYTLQRGVSGDIVVPVLKSMKILDLFRHVAYHTNKTIRVSGKRPGEKVHEMLINESELMNSGKVGNMYVKIYPYYKKVDEQSDQLKVYESSGSVMDSNSLILYLKRINILR
ncbi:polysaccharide biosynthesis protein CapD [Gonapodya prolifera JEL478]|uniref:Polysaccharide biosynthesis protein CapD n=1 Tax=Gonapodya prolifera (strain JEL478) TaxID=1344416 RepID=A0A138ZWC6_GONPJ|nr:polysaccharide biosynthesis protein CapD [Gonapodya prolifera JEL478]|eukprot:KXS08796.1 polysaccharide biosynthesis protein CapD [Gonapodya prolifera JEL478]